MRKRLLLLVLAISVAGCLDAGSSGTATESTAETPEPTTTDPPDVTTSYGYDCPYIISVDPATERQLNDTDRTLDYENLSTERQQEFRQGIGGSVEMETLPDAWSGPVIVTYEGERYYVVASVC